MYKISIIIPIFNVEPYLKRALNSIINQTMDFNDIEIIMVDDCSTDNSGKIIEEYSNKYSNFIGIFHEKNSGRAAIPRNTGLKRASGKYIMFLDPDDEYFLNACETLYDNIEKYDVDVVFGRFVHRYIDKYGVEKSYSPYEDDINEKYNNLTFDVKNDSKLNKIINNFFCGKWPNYSNPGDIVCINDINQNPIILKLAAAVWTKIYKREFLFNNNIYFPSFKLGEDSAFVLETLLKANGIIFLNNLLVCYYSVRDSDEDRSVSRNINFQLLDEGIDNQIYCNKITIGFSNTIRIFSVNPHILLWFYLWRQSNLTKSENNYLIGKLFVLKNISGTPFKTRFLIFFVINFIRFSSIL